MLIFFYLFFSNKIFTDKELENKSIKNIEELNRLLNLKEYFLERFQSPYKKYTYTIKNNDSIEKIFNKHNINYNETKIRHEIKKISQNGVDLVIDMVGGEPADDAIKNLAWEGKYVSVGYASGIIPKISAILLIAKLSNKLAVFLIFI